MPIDAGRGTGASCGGRLRSSRAMRLQTGTSCGGRLRSSRAIRLSSVEAANGSTIPQSSLHRSDLSVAGDPFFLPRKLRRSVPFLPHRSREPWWSPRNCSRRGMTIDAGQGTGASCGGRLWRRCNFICRCSICRRSMPPLNLSLFHPRLFHLPIHAVVKAGDTILCQG